MIDFTKCVTKCTEWNTLDLIQVGWFRALHAWMRFIVLHSVHLVTDVVCTVASVLHITVAGVTAVFPDRRMRRPTGPSSLQRWSTCRCTWSTS